MGTSLRKDKNNVNIDVEMAEFSKNYIKFNALTRELSSHLSRIKMSISKGGK
jgi:flagellar basal-body rod protein FlgB